MKEKDQVQLNLELSCSWKLLMKWWEMADWSYYTRPSNYVKGRNKSKCSWDGLSGEVYWIPILRETQYLTGQDPEQPNLTPLLKHMVSKGPFQSTFSNILKTNKTYLAMLNGRENFESSDLALSASVHCFKTILLSR